MQVMSLIKNGSPEAPSVANPTLVFQRYSSPTPVVYSLLLPCFPTCLSLYTGKWISEMFLMGIRTLEDIN